MGAILARPDEHAGKALAGATRCYTMTEMAEIMARSSGRKITYTQVPKDAFAGFLPEASRPTLLNMLSYFEEFGYYGPDTEQLVKEAATSCEGGPGWIWGVPEAGATAALRVRMFLFQNCINVERCLSSSCRSPVLGLAGLADLRIVGSCPHPWSSAPLHSDPWSCHHNKLPGLIDGWMAGRRVDPRSRVSSPRHSRCLSSKNLEIKVPRYHRRRQPRRQSF